MVYGYIRLGNHYHSEDDWRFHEEDLVRAGAQKIIREQGGPISQHPNRDLMLAKLQKSDKLIMVAMSRLSRDMDECCAILEDLIARGVEVRFLKECLSSSDSCFLDMVHIIRDCAQE